MLKEETLSGRLDRRRSDRFVLHQVVEIGFGRETFVRCIGLDVSRSGIRCQTDQELALAATADVMFSFPISETAKHTIRVEAVIMRCVALKNGLFDVGMHFADLPEADRSALARYCDQGPESA